MRNEDEYIAKIRLESLLWATYITFAVQNLRAMKNNIRVERAILRITQQQLAEIAFLILLEKLS